MKLFIQDLGYRGCVIAIAKDVESAKVELQNTEYDPEASWDLEQEIGDEPIVYESYGDR